MGNNAEIFYDKYSKRQKNAGIHHRHLFIQRWLEKVGLKRNHNILEIGCGIGTVTQLMLQYLSSEAQLTAIDISPKSIEVAEKRLFNYDNLDLIAGDIIELEIENIFDVIVLPDVLEHIPLNKHNALFEKLSALLSDNGFIFINIPNPEYLEWVTENRPDELQIIDNPIHTDKLLSVVYEHGLFIQHLTNYTIFHEPEDYQVIILKKRTQREFTPIESPQNDSILRRLKRRLRLVLGGK